MTKKTTEKPQVKPQTAAQKFHEEINKLKPLLPADWRMQLFKLLPAYDSYRGGVLLKNVMSGKSTDTAILEALKKITNTK